MQITRRCGNSSVVEHNLAKVVVASSSLVSRSSLSDKNTSRFFLAGWQSGDAAACKAVYAGSIPASASKVVHKYAQVAKQVDARDLKSLGGNTMPVRFRPWVPITHFVVVRKSSK